MHPFWSCDSVPLQIIYICGWSRKLIPKFTSCSSQWALNSHSRSGNPSPIKGPCYHLWELSFTDTYKVRIKFTGCELHTWNYCKFNLSSLHLALLHGCSMNCVSQKRRKELEVMQNTCCFSCHWHPLVPPRAIHKRSIPRAKEYWFWSTEHTFKLRWQLDSKKL